jgi:hypothetical protein
MCRVMLTVTEGSHTADPKVRVMCRNIRQLHNFDPPATDAEVRAAALQYVCKIGGASKPSQANQAAYDQAVEAVAAATRELLDALVTSAPPKDREQEAAKARARAAQRYAQTP